MLKMPQETLSQSWWATTLPPNAVDFSPKNKKMRWQTEVVRQLLPSFAYLGSQQRLILQHGIRE